MRAVELGLSSALKRVLCVGIAALAAASCATPEERAAGAQQRMDETIATYAPACERLGYKAHTDGWRDCILRLSIRDSYQLYRMSPWSMNCFDSPGFGLYPCSMY